MHAAFKTFFHLFFRIKHKKKIKTNFFKVFAKMTVFSSKTWRFLLEEAKVSEQPPIFLIPYNLIQNFQFAISPTKC